MQIIADQEAVDVLTQASDAILKSYWNQWMWLSNKILWCIQHLEDFEVSPKWCETEKKEPIGAGVGAVKENKELKIVKKEVK